MMEQWTTGIIRKPRVIRKDKYIQPTRWGKFIIDLFYIHLMNYDVVKVKGFGIFLVDEKWPMMGRKTIRLPWWKAIL